MKSDLFSLRTVPHAEVLTFGVSMLTFVCALVIFLKEKELVFQAAATRNHSGPCKVNNEIICETPLYLRSVALDARAGLNGSSETLVIDGSTTGRFVFEDIPGRQGTKRAVAIRSATNLGVTGFVDTTSEQLSFLPEQSATGGALDQFRFEYQDTLKAYLWLADGDCAHSLCQTGAYVGVDQSTKKIQLYSRSSTIPTSMKSDYLWQLESWQQ